LAHLSINISNHKSKHGPQYPVKALLDTGCAKTCMTKELFDNISQLGSINLFMDKSVQLGIISCTGNTETVTGMAKMFIHFTDVNDKVISVILTAMVVPSLAEDFILGYDFLGSSFVKSIDKYHLHLQQPKSTVEYLIPLITNQLPSIPCRINTTTLIPPQSFKWVQGQVTENNFQAPLMVNSIQYPEITILDTIYYPNNEGIITFPIYNDSIEEMVISPQDNLVNFVHLNTFYQVNRMSVSDMYDEDISINFSSPNPISQDIDLNQNEKKEAVIEFKQNGIFQPSMTHIIETHSGLTELELQNTTPISEQDFDSQFFLDHLSNKDKIKL